jgi:GNAT superfamily N-acetyltransferase
MAATGMIRQFSHEDSVDCSNIIRACIERDQRLAPEVRELIIASASPKELAEFAGLYYLAVYTLGNRIMGICGLDMNEIRLLYVSPLHSGRGIGSMLLEHVESVVPADFFSDIFVYSSLSARSFYQGHGFRSGGVYIFHHSGIPIRTVFMAKPIGAVNGC